MSKTKKNQYKIEPGQNAHIDRIRALYPDDYDIYRVDGKIEFRPKGTPLVEVDNG